MRESREVTGREANCLPAPVSWCDGQKAEQSVKGEEWGSARLGRAGYRTDVEGGVYWSYLQAPVSYGPLLSLTLVLCQQMDCHMTNETHWGSGGFLQGKGMKVW